MSLWTGLSICGVLGVIYGLAIAFAFTTAERAGARQRFVTVGAVVLLVALVLLAGIPLLRGER